MVGEEAFLVGFAQWFDFRDESGPFSERWGRQVLANGREGWKGRAARAAQLVSAPRGIPKLSESLRSRSIAEHAVCRPR